MHEGPTNLPAKGGQLLELDWHGNVVWEHVDHNQHHDFRRIPNGNTIYVAWRLLTEEETKKIDGGLPGTEHTDGIYGDVIREVSPCGEIVWEWDAVRDFDPTKAPLMPGVSRKEYAHCNPVFPCANGDILINQQMNGMMSIIDKQSQNIKWSLTNYDFGQQHDVKKLENGNLLFFANGATHASFGGPETGSRVIEINPDTKDIVWEYFGVPATSFFSWFISSCQRLTSGNTLICEGAWGRIFEVTPEREIVWDFAHPYKINNPSTSSHGGYTLFRAYRYSADSPQIQGRLGRPD